MAKIYHFPCEGHRPLRASPSLASLAEEKVWHEKRIFHTGVYPNMKDAYEKSQRKKDLNTAIDILRSIT